MKMRENMLCVALCAHFFSMLGCVSERESVCVYMRLRSGDSCCEIQTEVISKALVAECNTHNMLSRTLLRDVCVSMCSGVCVYTYTDG